MIDFLIIGGGAAGLYAASLIKDALSYSNAMMNAAGSSYSQEAVGAIIRIQVLSKTCLSIIMAAGNS